MFGGKGVAVTEWEPATETEAAMRDALRANDQELYFRILARTELLLPVSAQALAGRVPMGWGTWTTGGRTHVLAFTSVAAVQACLAENAGSTRRTSYRELAAAWPNHEWWLAVNPGLPIEGYLPAWFVAQLARGDVRLPGRPIGARTRLEQVENAARARATAAVPGQMPPGEQRGPVPPYHDPYAEPAGVPVGMASAAGPAPAAVPVPPAPYAPPPVPFGVPSPATRPGEPVSAALVGPTSEHALAAWVTATASPPLVDDPSGGRPGHQPGVRQPSTATTAGRATEAFAAGRAAQAGGTTRPTIASGMFAPAPPTAPHRADPAVGGVGFGDGDRAGPAGTSGAGGAWSAFQSRNSAGGGMSAGGTTSAGTIPAGVAGAGMTTHERNGAPAGGREEAPSGRGTTAPGEAAAGRGDVTGGDVAAGRPEASGDREEAAAAWKGGTGTGPVGSNAGPVAPASAMPSPAAPAPAVSGPISPEPPRPDPAGDTTVAMEPAGSAGGSDRFEFFTPARADRTAGSSPPLAGQDAESTGTRPDPATPVTSPQQPAAGAQAGPGVSQVPQASAPQGPAPETPASAGSPAPASATPHGPKDNVATPPVPPGFTPAHEFTPANEVERNLLAATAEGRTDSYLSTLLLAKVLLPVSPAASSGTRPGEEGFAWRTETIDGATYVVVFTSPQRLADHLDEGTETVTVKFAQLIQEWPQNDWSFAVNPGTPVGARFPGSQIVALANWAAEVGLGADPDSGTEGGGAAAAGDGSTGTAGGGTATAGSSSTPDGTATAGTSPNPNGAAAAGGDSTHADPGPTTHAGPTAAVGPAAAQRATYAPPREDPNAPTLMQKTVAPNQVDYYLERGYDRVSGFVHRANEIAHLDTPAKLYAALGLGYPGSPFDRTAAEVYVLRWPAYRPSLYRIPYGGQNEAAMRAMEGWVIERPPFRGNGFAPGENRDVVAEFKVDSIRLPHGSRLCRLGADGTEKLVAVLDADARVWRRTTEE